MKLSSDDIMCFYNWFHHAFPNFRENKKCSKRDIALRLKLQTWLIAHGK